METNESENRLKTLKDQYDVECDILSADPGTAVAIFIVPTMVTPLFFNPDDIYEDPSDGLFKLRKGKEAPEGLLDPDIANDPKQLSTVLARVLSIRDMLERHIDVSILVVDQARLRIDDRTKEVEPAKGSILERYAERYEVIRISPDYYERIKDKVGAANYGYRKNGEAILAAIFANQANSPNALNQPIDIFFGEEACLYVLMADEALRTTKLLIPSAEGIDRATVRRKWTSNDGLGKGP